MYTTLKINQQEIAYLDEGNGSPLILMHANPGDHQDFEAIIPALTQQFRVLAIDWPGFGKSPAPNPPQSASAFMYADLLQAFIEKLDLSNVILIGNSVGGFAATRAAIDIPEQISGLILVSSGGFTENNLLTRTFSNLQGSEWITKHTVKAFAQWYLHKDTAVTRAMLTRCTTTQKTETAVAVNAAVWRSFLRPDHDLRQEASAIQCPTLVINGKHDPVIAANKDGKAAATSIPNAKQIVLETGHAPFAEEPARFLDVINQFFVENKLQDKQLVKS